jgi:hypothetical protein
MVKNAMRAILCSAFLVIAIATLPYLVIFMALMLGSDSPSRDPVHDFWLLFAASPATFSYFNQWDDLRRIVSVPLVPALIQIAMQGLVLWLIRSHILSHADWYLGRLSPRSAAPPESNQTASVPTVEDDGTPSTAIEVVGAAS